MSRRSSGLSGVVSHSTTTEGEDCKGVLYEAIITLKDVKQSILISRKATE